MTPADALQFVIEPGLRLLPATMDTVPARAMLLAIGLQESRFTHRAQIRGPARGFFQFEAPGIRGVLAHRASAPHIKQVLDRLAYADSATMSYNAVQYADGLATCYARLLLWTLPQPLPAHDQPDDAWGQYIETWRPGRPHRETWDGFFDTAWRVATSGE
jgi:hypothetical protein